MRYLLFFLESKYILNIDVVVYMYSDNDYVGGVLVIG